MKILDVCAFYAPQGGGVRTYVEQKLAAGPARGHEIVVVAPGAENRTEWRGPGARIEWLAAPRLPVDRRYRYFESSAVLHAKLDEERPDFVEASSPWRCASAVASWRSQTPRALVMHADPLAAYAYRWLEAFAEPERVDRSLDWAWRYFRRLDEAFTAVVSASRSLSARLTGQGLRNVATVPMGIDQNCFSPALRDPELRARLLARCALPPEATLLLGVGRHAPEKRWPMVVRAVAAAGITHPVGLILAGDGRDRARVLRQIDGNPHIQLLSPIADRLELARLMASCDALIHGCEAETFSMVAAEAVASGLPIIVPDRGGAADHALPDKGLLYAATDAASAAEAIRTFIDARAPRPAPRARTMAQHFDELFALYETCAEGRAAA